MKGEFSMNKSSIVVIAILVLVIAAIVSKGFENKKDKNKEPKETNTKVVNNVKSVNTDNKSTPVKKDKIKKLTMADEAKKQLTTDNMINEDFITVVHVLQKIDENMRSIKIEPTLFGIYQTFEFSDESKIKLAKKEKGNGDFRFVPYATKVIND